MGYLWENMKKNDVQASQAALTQVKTELADAQSQLADTQSKYADIENKYTDTQAEIARLKDLLAVHGIAQE